VTQAIFNEATNLTPTARGVHGFGSTGHQENE
jgi:dUTPase